MRMWILFTLACITCGSHFVTAKVAGAEINSFADRESCADRMNSLAREIELDILICRNSKSGETIFALRSMTH